MTQFTAIILAGGQSRRMGADKALLPYHGKPLISYALDLASHYTRDILISSGNQKLKQFGYQVVPDISSVGAPLAGIHAGLLSSRTDWNLVLTCDMPHVSIGLVDKLLAVLDDDIRLIFPVHSGFYEPLCGFYHRELIPVIERNLRQGRNSMLDLPAEVFHRFLEMDDQPANDISFLFKNVNERKDLTGSSAVSSHPKPFSSF